MLWRTGFFLPDGTFLSFSAAELTTQLATRQNAGVTLGELEGWLNTLPDTDPVLRKRGEDATVLEDLSADDQVTPTMLSRKNRVLNCPDFTLRAGAPLARHPRREGLSGRPRVLGDALPSQRFPLPLGVRTLSQRQVDTLGLPVEKEMPQAGVWADPKTGMEYFVHFPGPDKGFRNNPGKDWAESGLNLAKCPERDRKSYEKLRGPATRRPARPRRSERMPTLAQASRSFAGNLPQTMASNGS